MTKLAYFLPFLNPDTPVEKGNTTSDNDSDQQIKITAGKIAKKVVSDD
jgi:hypothetical protein